MPNKIPTVTFYVNRIGLNFRMRPLVFLTLLLAVVPTVLSAGVDIRVISENNGELVVELVPSPGEVAPLPAARFYVAVPPSGEVSVTRIGGSFTTRPIATAEVGELEMYQKHLGDPPPLYPAVPVVVSEPFVFRKTRLVGIDCYLRQLDGTTGIARDWTPYRVAVRYPAARKVLPRSASDPLLANKVINRDVFPAPSRERSYRLAAAVDSAFSLSSNWIKIEINERGMYTITGSDLIDEGISLATINDPSSFRMFTGGGGAQSRLFADGGSWEVGNWLQETAIHVEGDGDGTFDPADRIIFYGLGAQDWQDYYDSTSPDTVYYVHPRAQTNYYYLTWDGLFSGTPARMTPRDAAPAGFVERTTSRHRYYAERNLVKKLDYRGDGWLWSEILKAGPDNARLETFDIRNLVTSVPQEFRTVALAPYDASVIDVIGQDTVYVNENHHTVYELRRGTTSYPIGDYVWDGARGDFYYYHGRPVRIHGQFLAEGTNTFILRVPRDLNRKDWTYFAWYSLAYERNLNAEGSALGFSSPDTSGTVDFRCRNFSSSGAVYAFDVTEQFDVQLLQNLEVTSQGSTRQVRFSAALAAEKRHFWVAAAGGLRSLPTSAIRVYHPRDLRNATDGVNMVIVTHRSFRTAAGQLASYRASNLPNYTAPRINVVTTEEIYDNFSGGQPDPMAIRNYIKFLYDNFDDQYGNPHLAYVLLLGDATLDFKNYTSTRVDYVPTFLNLDPEPQKATSYATDDWYGHLDLSDQPLDAYGRLINGHGILDVAVGRVPAGSISEVTLLTTKIIGYETASDVEDWRNTVLLVADDASNACFEKGFTDQSENIAYYRLPQYVDIKKVYLAGYDDISGYKPESRRDLLDMWNDGTIVLNYIGHGSSQQFADEQVFLAQDVNILNNGYSLPIVMAFSCAVGDYANSSGLSLSEKLMLRIEGGAIGMLSASELTLVGANEYLMYAVFDRILPRSTGTGIPIGETLMLGKNDVQTSSGFSSSLEDNNWRYNLLCDPSLRVTVPVGDLRLSPTGADTLVAGLRKTLRGGVYFGGVFDASFSGTVHVTVREPDLYNRFSTDGNCWFLYRRAGGTIYKGTTEVTNGEFEVNFRVPRYARTGKLSYLTAYAEDGVTDAAVSEDSVFTLVQPSLADSSLLRPVDGSPRVQLGLKSGLKVVKPGESLQAIVNDGDGINILSTTNEGRHALLIDDGFPIDVTEFFKFDHGGTDTAGVLIYPLPELPMGNHRAIYKVGDSFGQTTLDTLQFAVADSMRYVAEAVLNYPNPFSTTTHFLITLSSRASIRLDIFTVSGKRIRRLETTRDGGAVGVNSYAEEWIFWDGRDASGDEIANGVYLYVVTVDFLDIERTPLVLRGKLSKIE